ncbi:MAG: LysR substrate-binding domain-containing protein [Betaproteobacteria bacterium]|nr:LysR substrate-binding domain-containing protein [Betaproteobacteria bacterium]
MTLTELRYIVAVARERHFRRAAEACFVSQPTLSVAVRKLEEELGVTLFERTNSEVSLTPIGTRIVEQASRVLDQVDVLQHIARQGDDPLRGPLKLGAIYTVAPYLLPSLIPALHRLAPNMPLLLEENFTHKLAERLRRGDLDVILVALPFDEPGVQVLPVYQEPFRVLMPQGHAWCTRKDIAAAELVGENMLLLGTGHCFRDQVLEACPALAHGASVSGMQRTLESGSLETIRYMVASGAGITVMPCTATLQLPAEYLVSRPFAAPAPQRQVALAWRSSYPRLAAVHAVEQAIRQCDLPCVDFLV